MDRLQRPFSVSSRFRGERQARGSVLIFAVILIVILFALGTAFVLYVRQENRASSNALRNNQADQAADAGLNLAVRNVRNALLLYTFVSPDGYFVLDPAKNYLNTDPAPIAGEPQRNLFRMFEAYSTESTAATTIANAEGHAWLWYHTDPGFFASSTLESGVEPLRFTDAKLSHYATNNGGVKQHFAGGPEHAGLARRFVVDLDQAGIAQFYNLPVGGKSLPITTWTGGRMAEVYIWIADLDGKINGVPQALGLDPVVTETSKDVGTAEIKYLRDFAGMSSITDPIIDGSLWSRTSLYGSPTEMWGQTGLPVPSSPAGYAYFNSRYGLERYFTAFADNDELSTTTAADKAAFLAKYGVSFMSVKDYENALNINTANYETLAAVLSRVPLVEPFVPTNPPDVAANQTIAAALAARICAKRPFLCRIDFEDFLAAHLPQNVAAPLSDATNKDLAAGMIYRAISKRASHAGLATPYTLPTLAQLAEIPGLTETHPDFQFLKDTVKQQARFEWFRKDDSPAIAPLASSLLTVKAFNNLLNSVNGKKRDGTYGLSYYSYDSVKEPVQVTGGNPPKFEYALLTAAEVPGSYDLDKPRGQPGALEVWRAQTPAANGGYYEMVFQAANEVDQQEIAYGDSVPLPPPAVALVTAGTDGILQTPPRTPDDIVVGTEIQDGGNSICDSWIHGPLRAYRLTNDPVAAKPTADIASGSAANGNVSWSPRFAFRSRFFAVYVLSRALDPTGQPYSGSTRRVEAVYDALKDQVIWHRQPLTEKRSLGDPEP